jgi:tetratricopeptide (TPR) repeat protein
LRIAYSFLYRPALQYWERFCLSRLNVVRLHEDAIGCCDKALAIDPRDASLCYNKALAEDGLRHWREAMSSYQKFVELAPPQFAQQIAYARQRIHELSLSG